MADAPKPKGIIEQAFDAYADMMDGTLFETSETTNATGPTAAPAATGTIVAAAAAPAAAGTGPLVPESTGAGRAVAPAHNRPPGAPASGQPANSPAPAAGAGVGGAGSTGAGS